MVALELVSIYWASIFQAWLQVEHWVKQGALAFNTLYVITGHPAQQWTNPHPYGPHAGFGLFSSGPESPRAQQICIFLPLKFESHPFGSGPLTSITSSLPNTRNGRNLSDHVYLLQCLGNRSLSAVVFSRHKDGGRLWSISDVCLG